ncbi:MAG: sugar ABC transporter substrate-binding protein [Lachnospiraceae bacterium]|nr:sugar ABC transporter substrate-binding protein [Lachnospiraceae bacterium]
MKLRKLLALTLASAMVFSIVGCGGKADTASAPAADSKTEADDAEASEAADAGDIINYTFFGSMPQPEINDGNEIQEIIAEKVGVRVKETWLTGQTAAEAVGTILASGEYPDLIDAGDASVQMYEADALVAWDDYLDKYPNLKEMYTDEEWNMFRQDDGKIYWANVFVNTYGEPKATGHNDEAFWVQARVLEEAGYPKIETLDEYFDLLEGYYAKHPTLEDGTPVIPYTILCEDWRYFCIENAPQFLDGYPNDGSVIVDKSGAAPKIVDYNTTETAKMYFGKLNEEFNKGMIDPEFATQTYDEYIAKLSTGAVLGICDQNWDFNYTIQDVFKTDGLDLKGCNYVPLGLTAKKGMENRWHTYADTLNNSSGIAVTTSCEDPDRAFKFLNDILDQEIHDLRFWGVEGVDYLVDEDGLYYRTDEMRANWADEKYQAAHRCQYSYMPQWLGTSRDGINAMQPQEQYSEFVSGMAEPLVKVFEAYGAKGYPDLIGSVVEENGPWFPMYSYSNAMTTDTEGGVAWTKMGETKHEWLPKVVMSSNFESEWNNYMKAYEECNPKAFLDEMQTELDRRANM